ncbi:hypothetical protein SAMN05446935_8084 [Burkholderia sp. YR290]|nr:hypothetical protein SAMN05446935_8084 [Burkholderia sp. YR290]
MSGLCRLFLPVFRTQLVRGQARVGALALNLFAHGVNRRFAHLRHRDIERAVTRARLGHGAFELPPQPLLLLVGQPPDFVFQHIARSLFLELSQ